MTLPATFGCAGPALLSDERALIRAARPWGFILFARNIETPEQLRRLTADLRAAAGRDAPVLIDQEGGRVARMAAPHWRTWAPPLDAVAAAPDAATAARMMHLRYRLIAAELAEAGIDVNCAPLADIAHEGTHPILRNRCYGTDAATVATIARAVADGLLAGGVLPVLKHIPGHGRASLDSHVDLPRIAADRATLEAEDFAPFRALADLPLGMTAHIVYDAIDLDRPATLSPDAIATIRGEIGFDGLLMTDDISMQALSGNVSARGRAALDAGCDIVLHCNGALPEMERLAADLPPMTDAARARWDRAAALRHRDPADTDALAADLDALQPGAAHV